MRSIFVALALVVVAGCGTAATKDDPCPRGICTGPGAASDSGPGAGPDGGPVGCTAAWSCTAWQKNPDGKYTRTCTDAKGCGTPSGKPGEGPVALPDLDKDFYDCNVEPIFDRGCAMLGCHGTEAGRAFKVYARGRLRNKEMVSQVASCPIGPQTLDLAESGTGTVMCVGWSPHTAAEWQANYDNARSFMVGITNPEESDLLAQPVYGGKAHTDVHLFTRTDPDYLTIKRWLGGAKLGSKCTPSPN